MAEVDPGRSNPEDGGWMAEVVQKQFSFNFLKVSFMKYNSVFLFFSDLGKEVRGRKVLDRVEGVKRLEWSTMVTPVLETQHLTCWLSIWSGWSWPLQLK
jgi:hypothetical protein